MFLITSLKRFQAFNPFFYIRQRDNIRIWKQNPKREEEQQQKTCLRINDDEWDGAISIKSYYWM